LSGGERDARLGDASVWAEMRKHGAARERWHLLLLSFVFFFLLLCLDRAREGALDLKISMAVLQVEVRSNWLGVWVI
jgi:hypothetical protein